jgi:hypothetical protein
MRQIGPINKHEVQEFQKRYGLNVDGKFGNQSMGQVLDVEMSAMNWRAKAESLQPKLDRAVQLLSESQDYNKRLEEALKEEKAKSWWQRLLFG